MFAPSSHLDFGPVFASTGADRAVACCARAVIRRNAVGETGVAYSDLREADQTSSSRCGVGRAETGERLLAVGTREWDDSASLAIGLVPGSSSVAVMNSGDDDNDLPLRVRGRYDWSMGSDAASGVTLRSFRWPVLRFLLVGTLVVLVEVLGP